MFADEDSDDETLLRQQEAANRYFQQIRLCAS